MVRIAIYSLVFGLLLIFFFAVHASIHVRSAIKDSALAQPIYGCISAPDQKRLEGIVDRAFVRGIQKHDQPTGGRSMIWHWHGAIAYVGMIVSYSWDDRQALMLPNLQQTPPCPARSGTEPAFQRVSPA